MIKKAVEDLDRVPEKNLIWINLALTGLVILLQGISIILHITEGSGLTGMTKIALPLSVVVAITGVAALFSNSFVQKALSVHALILLLGSVQFFYDGLSLLIYGLPDGNFSWRLGFLTYLCFYPVYLIRRTFFKHKIYNSFFVKYIHVFVFLVVLAIDFSVFIKSFMSFHQR